MAHALLGLCLSRRKQYQQATEEAQLAVHYAPDFSFTHFVHASVLHDRDRLNEALSAIEEAIRLDPAQADSYALLSAIRLDQRQWALSLEAAERGLQLNPEHVGCTNLRAMALVKLGRRQEALMAMGTTLAKDPENALSHANQGWTLLEQGSREQALEHFREALRINPELEWARQGIVEALKAKHVLYGMMLRYFLWMSRLTPRAQWGIVLGGYFGFRLLRNIVRTNPELAPWIWPLLIVYILFAFLTWIADPLFNLILRLDRFGRLALSREQTIASNWIGACLLTALLSAGAWLVTKRSDTLISALVFALLVLPLAGTFRCRGGWPRKAMATYTGVVGVVGLGFLTALAMWPDRREGTPHPTHVTLFVVFFLGVVFSTWVSNTLVFVRPKR
jgi:tetratricopeptide (TPR) repeat protein